MTATLWLILGMAAVTYVPRLLPFVLFQNMKLPPFVNKVLKNIPYAVLGALIFPGILSVDPENAWFGAVGGVTAVIIAWFGLPLLAVLGGSIVVLFLIQSF